MPVLLLDPRSLDRLLPPKDAGHRKFPSFAEYYVPKAVISLHFRKQSLELKCHRRQWCPHGNGACVVETKHDDASNRTPAANFAGRAGFHKRIGRSTAPKITTRSPSYSFQALPIDRRPPRSNHSYTNEGRPRPLGTEPMTILTKRGCDRPISRGVLPSSATGGIVPGRQGTAGPSIAFASGRELR